MIAGLLRSKLEPRGIGRFGQKKSGPTDHLLGKPINLGASQSDRLECRDIKDRATRVPKLSADKIFVVIRENRMGNGRNVRRAEISGNLLGSIRVRDRTKQ